MTDNSSPEVAATSAAERKPLSPAAKRALAEAESGSGGVEVFEGVVHDGRNV